MKNLIGLLFILILGIEAQAQNLSGSWGYEIDEHYVRVYGDKIQNQNNGGRTGTLQIALYATDYPYRGGNIRGYELYTYELDPLDAGYVYTGVSNTGWCTYPPDGSYSLTILLLEYSYGSFEIVDHVTLSGYVNF